MFEDAFPDQVYILERMFGVGFPDRYSATNPKPETPNPINPELFNIL